MHSHDKKKGEKDCDCEHHDEQPKKEKEEKETKPIDLVPVVKDIYWAISNNDFEVVKDFVEGKKVDINSKDPEGNTPLHWTALKQNLEIMKYLIDNGALIDAANDSEGQTPLMWACISGELSIVHYLLEHGANVHLCDKRGYNALHHAVQYNKALVSHFLIGRGLQIDSRDNEGHTPLMWAAYLDHDETLRYLLGNGSDATLVDNTGCTALHWAALKGSTNCATVLLEHGADPNVQDNAHETPHQMASRKGHLKLSKVFVRAERHPDSFKTVAQGNNNLWFFVGFFVVHISFYLLCEAPSFLLGLGLFVLMLYAIKWYLGHLWPGQNHANPLWTGIIIASYWISFVIYFSTTIYLTSSYTILTILFFITNSAFVPTYLWLIRSDPGTIRADPNHNEWNQFLTALENKEPLPGFCLTCHVRRPIRSKHCAACKKCVARFDHHCGWINNCVGASNIAPFVVALILVIVNHWLFAVICYLAITTSSPVPSLFPAVWNSFPAYYTAMPWTFMLGLYHFANSLWESWLLYGLTRSMCINITTNEYLNGHRYNYLRHPKTGRFSNPFDKQHPLANIKDSLFGDVNWFQLYHVPANYYR